jgi:hypothetical protein
VRAVGEPPSLPDLVDRRRPQAGVGQVAPATLKAPVPDPLCNGHTYHDWFSIRALANNRYVSVERGYTGNYADMLRARATAIGEWERFDFLVDACEYNCST